MFIFISFLLLLIEPFFDLIDFLLCLLPTVYLLLDLSNDCSSSFVFRKFMALITSTFFVVISSVGLL